MNRYINKGSIVLLVIAIATLLIRTAIWYTESRDLTEAIRLVGHTREILSELEAIGSETATATSRIRDYIKTGNEADVTAQIAAQNSGLSHLRRLQSLVSDNPGQLQRIEVLQRELKVRSELMQKVLMLRNERGERAAEATLDEGLTSESTLLFRNQLQSMREAEENLLNERADKAAATSKGIFSLVTVLSVVALVFFGLFAYSLRRNLGARQRAEDGLKEIEERTRLILEQAHSAYIEMDSAGIISGWNRQAEAVFGWSQAEAIGRRLSETIIPPPYRLSHELGLKRFLKTGQGRALNKLLQMKALHRDGHEFPVEFSISAIPLGDTYVYCAFLYDITVRERAQQGLRDSEERHRLMFDSSPVPMWVNDQKTLRILAVNDAVVRHYGYSKQELLSLSVKDVVAPEEIAVLSERAAEIPNVTERFISTRHRKKDGSIIDVEVRIHNLTFEDQPASLVLITDVTERRRAEKELKQAHAELTLSVQKLEQSKKELVRLGEMGELLQSCNTPQEAHVAVSRNIPLMFPGCRGVLYVINSSRNLVEAVAVWGGIQLETPIFAPDDCWALRRGRIHTFERHGFSPECLHRKVSGEADYVCVPMMAQGDALGVLHLEISAPRGSDAEAGKVSQDGLESQLQLAATASEQIALALANLKLRETLQNQSIRDPLTNLFNRRYMEECIDRELHRSARSVLPMAVILIDIDHFKRFNDTFGHDVGDEMLRTVARFLQQNFRTEDVACRYGGEEFVLLLSNSTPEGAMQRAEQLRLAIKQINVNVREQAVGSVSLSVGVASFPIHGSSKEALLLAADQALYRAKADGRDRVVLGVSNQLRQV